MADKKSKNAYNKKAEKKDTYSKGLTDVSGRDGFYRNKIGVGRWSYGMDVLKSNFAKLVGVNLIMIVFVAPIVLLLFLRYSQEYGLAHAAPFTANVGVGYAPFTNLVAQEEYIVLQINWAFFRWLPIVGLWLSVGLSGAMYVIRNVCWGEDVSIIKDFFLGIKRNIIPVAIATLLFSLIFASAWMGISYLDYIGAAAGGKAWYQIVVKVVIIIGMVFASLWYLAVLSLSVTYKANFFALLKNGLLISGVLLPMNVFFSVIAALPFGLLFLGSSFMLLGVIAVAIIGLSYFMVVWTVYSQWIYDKFINNNIKNAYKPTEQDESLKKQRDAAKTGQFEEDAGYETVGGGEDVTAFAANAKPITDTGITVSTIPSVYTLSDIMKVKSSKADMKKDAEEYSADPKAYRNAHKEQFEETEMTEEEMADLAASTEENGDKTEQSNAADKKD